MRRTARDVTLTASSGNVARNLSSNIIGAGPPTFAASPDSSAPPDKLSANDAQSLPSTARGECICACVASLPSSSHLTAPNLSFDLSYDQINIHIYIIAFISHNFPKIKKQCIFVLKLPLLFVQVKSLVTVTFVMGKLAKPMVYASRLSKRKTES